VTDKIAPTWSFLYQQLVSCEDVEVLIVGDPDFGHFLTVTGFLWTDADSDNIMDPGENGTIFFIDPCTGAPGNAHMWQTGLNTQLYVDYLAASGPITAELIMTVSESVPEPCTMGLLVFSGLVVLRRKRRS